MIPEKEHRGGRRPIPKHLKSTNTNWTMKPAFQQLVAEMAIASGAISTSAYVVEALEEKMEKTRKELQISDT